MTWNDDFPVHIRTFTDKLIGTEDEVWTKVLHRAHGHKKLTEKEFSALLDGHRDPKPEVTEAPQSDESPEADL